MKIFHSLILCLYIFGCRGWESQKPPVHLNPNMDAQPKYKPFGRNDFFIDQRNMRPRVVGVVARGELNTLSNIENLKTNFEIDKAFVLQGRRLYNAHCSHCHDQAGSGQGLVGLKLPVKPSSFHTDYLRNMPDKHFFDVITNGIRTMYPHGYMLDEKERWHIVSYLRVLQLSQDAKGDFLKKINNKAS
jgi:cytochrome c5